MSSRTDRADFASSNTTCAIADHGVTVMDRPSAVRCGSSPAADPVTTPQAATTDVVTTLAAEVERWAGAMDVPGRHAL